MARVEVKTSQLQAELPFSREDRREMDYPKRVRALRELASDVTNYFGSNFLITDREERVRIFPGIAQVFFRKASGDPREPVVAIHAGDYPVATIQVIQLHWTSFIQDKNGAIFWEVLEKGQASSDDLDDFGAILNRVSAHETEKTAREVRSWEADLIDAVFCLPSQGKTWGQVKADRKWAMSGFPDSRRLFDLAMKQRARGLITDENLSGLMMNGRLTEEDFNKARRLLVKPHWQPLV